MGKDKFQVTNDTEQLGSFIGEVGYKPKWALIICCVIGVALCLTMNWIAILFGVMLAGISLFLNYKVKEYKVMGIYDQGILLYPNPNKKEDSIRRIHFDEIAEWTVKSGANSADALMIQRADNEILYIVTFQTGKAANFLNKVIPNKESRKIQEEKNKQKAVKFKWPFKKRK